LGSIAVTLIVDVCKGILSTRLNIGGDGDKNESDFAIDTGGNGIPEIGREEDVQEDDKGDAIKDVEVVELEAKEAGAEDGELDEAEFKVDVEDKAETGNEDEVDEVDECESGTTLTAWILPNTERESGGQRTPGEGVSCPSAKREISCKIESFGENPASPSKANSCRRITARDASVWEIDQTESGVRVSVLRVGDETEETNFLKTLSSAT